METPCPRCGTLKTESVRHGWVYRICWKMGYHLRRCSFCNRKRLIRRGDRSRPHPNDLTMEQLQESFNRQLAAAKAAGERKAYAASDDSSSPAPSSSPAIQTQAATGVEEPVAGIEDYRLCPRCGNPRFRRSRRRWYERLMNRPRMARCRRCGHRFPYPHSIRDF